MDLINYGWNDFFEECFAPLRAEEYSAGRIAIQNKNNYMLYTEFGELSGEVSGKLFYEVEEDITGESSLPAVGDWVAFRPYPEEKKAIIDKVLPRQSKFSRKEAGIRTKEQVVAANIDNIFIMASLNQDFNIRRLERYLILGAESGSRPVIVLSKADLCEDAERMSAEVKAIAGKVPVCIVSSLTGKGIEELLGFFGGNKTVAVIGSSGVGKSTLINTLYGEERMKVKDITEYKDKGQHTTTHRELVRLPGGGLIIDTPGMREIQLWGGDEGASEVFDDIEELMQTCKFSDCSHTSEPGCSVLEALEDGTLDEDRYKSYKKLQREIRYLESRNNKKMMHNTKKKWKQITKAVREKNKYRKGGL